MCGIAGIFLDNSSERLNYINSMLSTLIHRGPDDSGTWVDKDNRIAFGHRRLSIQDLSFAGQQPMHSSSGRYVITYNGEIYNFKYLKVQLSRLGYNFISDTDTEVLLAAIETWGIKKALDNCTGMFAFALWDKQKKNLILARDRFGEKPLYYGWNKGVLVFASELKAILQYPVWNKQINRNALASLMRYSYIPAPHSIYQNIYKVIPGTYIEIISEEKIIQTEYWSTRKIAANGLDLQDTCELSDEEALKSLSYYLENSIRNQSVSDAPLGALLSGGIDSSLVTALMQKQSNRPIKTFSLGFENNDYNEANYARKIAQYLETEHAELYLTEKDIYSVVPKLPYIYDEPFADSSQIPTYLVSQLAKGRVSVALSGDAGDELFGGYNRYLFAETIFNKSLYLPKKLREIFLDIIITISPQTWHIIYKFISYALPKKYNINFFGDKLHKLVDILRNANTKDNLYKALISIVQHPEALVLGVDDISNLDISLINEDQFIQSMMLIDTLNYLPGDILTKIDRASMAVGLELRAPFLDHHLFEFAWKLPLHFKIRNGQTKWLLRELLYRHVPQKLIDRPKMGFGVPLDEWLRGSLREWAEDLLNPRKIKIQGYLNESYVSRLWHEHLNGKRNWKLQLWNILMFQAWLEVYE